MADGRWLIGVGTGVVVDKYSHRSSSQAYFLHVCPPNGIQIERQASLLSGFNLTLFYCYPTQPVRLSAHHTVAPYKVNFQDNPLPGIATNECVRGKKAVYSLFQMALKYHAQLGDPANSQNHASRCFLILLDSILPRETNQITIND